MIIYDFKISGDSNVSWNGNLLIEQEKEKVFISFTAGGSNDPIHEKEISKERAAKLISSHKNAANKKEALNAELVAMEITTAR